MPDYRFAEVDVRAGEPAIARPLLRMPHPLALAFFFFFFFLTAQLDPAQPAAASVSIQVHVDQSEGAVAPVWNYFGYDEPNYTYASNGKRLLDELAAASAAPVYVRVHNLLTSGDGSASLKWGSTNVYSEDASGGPIYSWTILDQIFDTFRAARVKPPFARFRTKL